MGSPPVVGCLLKKADKRGGGGGGQGHPTTSLATPLLCLVLYAPIHADWFHFSLTGNSL